MDMMWNMEKIEILYILGFVAVGIACRKKYYLEVFLIAFFAISLLIFCHVQFWLTNSGKYQTINYVIMAENKYQAETGEIVFGRIDKTSVAHHLLEPYLTVDKPASSIRDVVFNMEIYSDELLRELVMYHEIYIYVDDESQSGFRVESNSFTMNMLLYLVLHTFLWFMLLSLFADIYNVFFA